MSDFNNDNPWRPSGENPADPNVPGETQQQGAWTPPPPPTQSQEIPPYPYAESSAPIWEPKQESNNNPGGGRSWLRGMAIAVVAALIGGGVGAAVVVAADDDNDTATPSRADSAAVASPKSASNATATPSTIRGVLEKVEPAVVTIEVDGPQGEGSGTGMIVSSDGEVLTNSHVVDGARSIEVTLHGEKTPRKARLSGADATMDAALVKIENASNLPTVEFGDSEALNVGDEVVAIGNALALAGGPSVTSGIVSAKDRSISDETASLDDLIQTDTAINPGNSGGPLVNMAGQVVGMNTAVIRGIAGEFQNIGFSLAVNALRPALDDLRAGKSAAQAYLGVSSVTLNETARERFELTPQAGAIVDTVQPNSPADESDLQRFDVITSFDGTEIKTNDELVALVRKKRPGDEVKIVFFRGDERKEVTVTLGSRPNS